MSGRTKRKIQGRWVTGNRKTSRRNRPRQPQAQQRFDLTFQLPEALAWSTTPGKYGHYITVAANGLVTVSSCSGPHVRMIARGFLEKIAGGLQIDLSSIAMTVRATKVAAPALVIARAASHRETRSDGKEV